MKRKKTLRPRSNPTSGYANAAAMADAIRNALAPVFAGYEFRVGKGHVVEGSDESVRVGAYGIPAGSDELTRLNAQTMIALSVTTKRRGGWPKDAPPPEQVTVETTQTGIKRAPALRARTDTPEKIVQYVVKWMTEHADEIKGVVSTPSQAKPMSRPKSKPKSKPRSGPASGAEPVAEEPAWTRRWAGFTSADVEAANRYTHFPRELGSMNQGLRESMVALERPIREKLKRWGVIQNLDGPLPEDVDSALSGYHRALLHQQREDSRAAMIAPPWTVTGRSGYKGKPDKANKVLQNAKEVVDKALERVSRTVRGYDPQRPVMAGEQGAVERLQEKLQQVEATHAAMLAANKILRGKQSADDKLAALMALGWGEDRARKAFEPDFAGRIGFPAYELTSQTAEMKRIKDRIASLSQAKSLGEESIPFDGGEVIEDPEQMRLQIRFDSKPDKQTIEKLHAQSFNWSHKQGVWQRVLTDAARRAAREVVGPYDEGREQRPLGPPAPAKTAAQQRSETKLAARRQAVLDYMTQTPGFDLGRMTPEQASGLLAAMFRAQGYRERKKDNTFIAPDRQFTLDPANNKIRITVEVKGYSGSIIDSKSVEKDLTAEALGFGERTLAAFDKPVGAAPPAPRSSKPASKPARSSKPAGRPTGPVTEESYRKAVEAAFWREKSPDYKSITDGVKSVMWLEPGVGTTIIPLSSMPLEEMESSLGRAIASGKVTLPPKPASIATAQLYNIRRLLEEAGYDPVDAERLYESMGQHGLQTGLRLDRVGFAVSHGLKRMFKQASSRVPQLFIDGDNAILAFWSSGLEGEAWLARQEADSGSLSDPNGFYSNLAAYKVLKGMGDRAAGLTVADLVPSAGMVTGDEGRAYALLPDGQIALIAESASPDKRDQAARIMLVA